jgi:hypothetical protein
MNRTKQIFLLLVIVFALNACSGTIKGTINQHEWLQPDDNNSLNLTFIPNEPFAAQRQAYRDQGFTWYNKVNPRY